VVWTAVALAVWLAWSRSIGLHAVAQLQRRWRAGLVVGALAGAWLAYTVTRQPSSPSPTGAQLAVDVVLLGIVYGLADALILSILPVLALYGSQPPEVLRSPGGRLRWAAVALAGSALIAAAYHAGFREFQGAELIAPVIGNAVITATYLLSGSPVAPALAHVVMHVVALLHGPATTVQLPPHY
jgi:hypothetical protein